MEIRDAGESDDLGVSRVIEAAFGDAGVARLWQDVCDRGLDRLGLVAVDDDEVVGHVGLSVAWLDTRRALVEVLVLSPLSVAPERQRLGIGTALLAAALTRARTTHFPMLVLEGSPRYYGARGFVPGAAHGVEPATRRTPAPACQVVLLDSHESWMTGRIVYRDVWWEHDAAGLRDPDLASVEEQLGLT